MNTKSSILILQLIIWLVHGQNNETNVTSNEIPSVHNITTTPPPIWTSLDALCNQTETCQQYDEIKTNQEQYRDLRTRKCMCDTDCPTYGDCCEDSILHNASSRINVSFSCERMPYDGYIYMVKKCAPGYSGNSTIIENCQTTNRTKLLENFLLNLPVTNVPNKITYKNAYCALCNDELTFDFWESIIAYKLESQDRPVDIFTQNSTDPLSSNETQYETIIPDADTIISNITIDYNRSKLISRINGSSYLCQMLPNMVAIVIPGVRYCFSNSNDRVCSDCENSANTDCVVISPLAYGTPVIITLNSTFLPKINDCNVPANVSHRDVFCKKSLNAEPKPTPPEDIEQCFYYNSTGADCMVSTFYWPHEYEFLPNGSLRVYNYPYSFPPSEYTNDTSLPNVTYVCGTVIPQTETEKMYDRLNLVLTEIFIKFSIFFSFLYLVTNVNKQKLQSLPNKILFSFCITLLMTYLVLEISEPYILSTKLCRVAGVLTHYLLLSCFTWLLIASYDFWQVICRSSTKLQTLAGKTRLRRYLLYCCLGWISPWLIVGIALFFELSLNSVVRCLYKPGYGRLNQCFMAQYYGKLYFYNYPATVMFCAIIVLFAHTSYHIYQSKRKNIKSTAQNNYYMLFMKLALTMGLTWTTAITVTYTNSQFFRIIYVILNSSHGTLMYFAYGFKCTTLTKVYDKHKNNAIVQQTKSTFYSITDRIKSSSTQKSTSGDPPTQEMESTN